MKLDASIKMSLFSFNSMDRNMANYSTDLSFLSQYLLTQETVAGYDDDMIWKVFENSHYVMHQVINYTTYSEW